MAVEFESDRLFQLWEYRVSHGELMIRSPKSPAGTDGPERDTNVDIAFVGVKYLAVPCLLSGIRLKPPTDEEVNELKAIIGKSVTADNVWILSSSGKRFSVVGSRIWISENEMDIFESPFQKF
jgi:hypothetical protein